MIVKCPACIARYDIKTELPPQGRAVRCVKCATVWRALPEMVDDKIEPVKASGVAHFASTDKLWNQDAVNTSAPAGGSYNTPGSSGASASHEVTVKDKLRSRYVASKPLSEIEPLFIYRKGKYWFDRLTRKAKLREKSAAEPAAVTPTQATTRRNSCARPSKLSACEELRTLEQVREAVRKVFFSLGDRLSLVSAQTQPLQVTRVAPGKKAASSATGRRPGNFWTTPEEVGQNSSAGLAAHNSTSNTAHQRVSASVDLRESGSQDGYSANGKQEYPAGNGDAFAEVDNFRNTSSIADASLRHAMRAALRSSASPSTASIIADASLRYAMGAA